MMFLFAKLCGAGLTAAAAMLVVFFPAVAHADPPGPPWGPPPCQGSSCIGKDPQATQCSQFHPEYNPIQDEETTSSPGTADHAITLRYSPWCHASWGRLNADPISIAYYTVETVDGQQTEHAQGYYTSMLNGDFPTRACVEANFAGNCGQWYLMGSATADPIRYHVANTEGWGVRIRSAPSQQVSVIGGLLEGATITVACQTPGSDVNGSSIWDRLNTGGYLSDYYTDTPTIGDFSHGLAGC